jgi:hypothetical protein
MNVMVLSRTQTRGPNSTEIPRQETSNDLLQNLIEREGQYRQAPHTL